MQDLPVSPMGGTINNQPFTDAPVADGPVSSTVDLAGMTGGGLAKEFEIGGIVSAETQTFTEIGKDAELPKEVAAVGVRVQPTTVSIPAPLQSMGVKAAGQNTVSQGTATVLPLTDDEIAQGLHQGITSSWRWLAEWCRRRLKQMHVGLKIIH